MFYSLSSIGIGYYIIHKYFQSPCTWIHKGYKAMQAAREKEIMALTGGDERWENWVQFVLGQVGDWFRFGMCQSGR